MSNTATADGRWEQAQFGLAEREPEERWNAVNDETSDRDCLAGNIDRITIACSPEWRSGWALGRSSTAHDYVTLVGFASIVTGCSPLFSIVAGSFFRMATTSATHPVQVGSMSTSGTSSRMNVGSNSG